MSLVLSANAPAVVIIYMKRVIKMKKKRNYLKRNKTIAQVKH